MDDIEEFEKLIREKNISTVEDMQKESADYVRANVPNIEDKMNKIFNARGTVIEMSTILETVFNELITKTGGESLVIDEETTELKILTGLKTQEEMGSFGTFNKKAKLVKEIIVKFNEETDEEVPQDKLELFDNAAGLRDVFAHVPILMTSEELKFTDAKQFNHFFKNHPEWRDVKLAHALFMGYANWIIEFVPAYIKIILLNGLLISEILFGVSEPPKKENEKESDKQTSDDPTF